jgi:hypothetical protein
MNFGDLADVSVPDHLGTLARAFVRVTLITHLRGDVVLGRRRAQLTGFPDGPDQRLLHVDVLVPLHAPDRSSGMHMVGSRHDDCVDAVAFLIQHLAEILVPPRVREAFKGLRGAHIVHVTERHDVFRERCRAEVRGALSSRADGREVEFLVRGLVAQRLQRWSGSETSRRNSARQQAPEEKMSPRNCHFGLLLYQLFASARHFSAALKPISTISLS